MRKRWQLNRAGLVNFWYYHDEAEFHLSEGRLILRGSNGSGKSVTMQSFLPLVLDGDKRPWRLDPFGSKDRRIEYYLLLDENSGITDRTGYLYLEFYHPEQARFLTVGVGLRARRNVSGVNFWGFAVTDNRRVGKDLLLYDLDYSQGEEVKIPLSKSRLEEIIGSGGEVVTEPGQYKKLVNNLLFGFSDIQGYQELLDLLIQLRSPKLSKDFKPSTIYEILTAALPALQEDELRPLSEVLEDMDQIGDRLEELVVHIKEAELLQKSYNNYNEYLLYTESRRLLQQNKLWEEAHSRQIEQELDLQRIDGQINDGRERLKRLIIDAEQVKTELETLEQSEAVEKQAELERLKNDEIKTGNEISTAEKRWDEWKKRRERGWTEKEQYQGQISGNRREQQVLIEGMGEDARACEFLLHDLYQRQWEQGIKSANPVWEPWKREIGRHEQKLQEALKTAREEAALKLRTQEAEGDLSAARELRDKAEGQLRQAEQTWEKTLQEQQSLIFTWRKSLKELPLSDEAFKEILHLMTRFPEIPYDKAAASARESYDRVFHEIARDRAEWAHRKAGHLQQQKELKEKLQEWKVYREPEPARSEARERSRQRRSAAGEKGAPLFALCEFRAGLAENFKASLEAVMEQAGLLDAWISPGKFSIAGEDEEEIWFRPHPDLLAHTLADYLYPTPSEDGSLTAQFIDEVLRTIRVGDIGEANDMGGEAMVSETGYYSLGPVVGYAHTKSRAEYIGKETRRVTRLAEIARLEQLILAEEADINACEAEIGAINNRDQVLREELAAFPAGDSLYQANALVERKQRAFDSAMAEEEKKKLRFREMHNQWMEVRHSLKQLTEPWSLAKSEEGIFNYLNSLRSYRERCGELRALWTAALSLEKNLAAAERDWQEASFKVEEEAAYLSQKQTEIRALQTRIGVFEKLLQKLGIYDIHNQIRELKLRSSQLGKDIEISKSDLSNHEVAQRVKEIEVQKSREAVREQEVVRRSSLHSWQKEWNRRLVLKWQEEPVPDRETDDKAETHDTIIKLAKGIQKQLKGVFENKTRENVTNALFDVFHQIRQTLHEYSPEQSNDQEAGRIIIVFMKDRQTPITPHHLLKELQEALEEQRLLLNEKDRELYEQIIIHSVGKVIRNKIYRAEEWVKQMNNLMQQRQTSSGLRLRLKWEPRGASNENELDTAQLVKLLKTDTYLLRDEQREQMISHFKSRISWAKRESEERKETLRQWIVQMLDYRGWFRFTLEYEKGEQARRELTDARFNVLSGGEKAMAMYIPLFAATYSRYSNSRSDAPKIISLDEAFAGVDDENMRDMFELLTQLDFDYMMTSQVLWGCYDTVPSLSIYELYRPKDAGFVTLIRYHWNGRRRRLVANPADGIADAAAATDDAGANYDAGAFDE